MAGIGLQFVLDQTIGRHWQDYALDRHHTGTYETVSIRSELATGGILFLSGHGRSAEQRGWNP